MAWYSLNNEIKIYYSIYGRGDKSIVFINGLAMTTKSWIYQIDFFSKEYKVITYDQLCQGNSSKLIESFHYSTQVEILNNLLNYLKIKKAIIVGISYGSIVAKEFAILYENKVDKLILISPLYKIDFVLKKCYEIWESLLSKDELSTFYDILTYMTFNRAYLNQIESSFDLFKKNFLKIYNSKDILLLLKSFEKEKDLKNYKKIKIPTLIIGGDEDRLHNPDDMLSISNEIKNSKLSILKGDHGLVLSNYTEVNKEIYNFINN